MSMKRILVPATALLLLVLLPGRASASCVFLGPYPQRLAEAEIVFVGTVEETSNKDRNVVVIVEEIWKGSEIPETVEIRGGAQGRRTASSVDRHFEAGVRYLFAPDMQAPAGFFMDNACTPTRPFVDRLERFRPPDAIVVDHPGPATEGSPDPQVTVADDAREGGDLVPWIAASALAAAGLGAVLWRLRRH